MNIAEIENKLFHSYYLNFPITNREGDNDSPGYYGIWIKQNTDLPPPFSDELTIRATNLLYLGIAEKSLYTRLFEQDLQHKNPSTFFRAIGSILGYRPPVGSLRNKSNQNNYTFCQTDTDTICAWIDRNLVVSFCRCDVAHKSQEKILINKYAPILNWTHNPNKFNTLKFLRIECRQIAKHLPS